MGLVVDERLALRLGAFRLARRRGRSRDAAWASSRLRLEGVSLEPNEARFARAMRVRFGRALRAARIRRGQPIGASAAMPLVIVESGVRLRWIIAAIVGAAILLAALLLVFTRSEQGGEPEGARPASAAVITPPPPLRGRTEPGLAAVPVAPATPAAEAPPASAPPAAGGTGNAGTGTGSGGSGGGSGTGTGTRTPAPTPKPTPPPSPTVDPTGVHITGRIVDATTGQGLGGVCISIANLDCPSSPKTNPDGTFDVVLSSQATSTWIFQFIQPGYVTYTQRVPGGQSFNTGTLRLVRSR
jgi:hypothetical protein